MTSLDQVLIMALTIYVFCCCSDANSGSPQLFLNKKLSVRQMMSMIRQQIGNDSAEDSSAEVQRRLQRMLEETLTKNMHLQVSITMFSFLL